MPLPPTTTSRLLYNLLSRHFSSASASATASASASNLPTLPNTLLKIRSRNRHQIIQEAQMALTDYLHSTRSLHYTYAEHIAKNSIFSLSSLIAKVDSSRPTFLKSFQRFLRYNPINEFEFFYESIGIQYTQINDFLPQNKFFISEKLRVFEAACELSGFGFPWNRLGELYKEDKSIFDMDPRDLNDKLHQIQACGFDSELVIAICLVFPWVLSEDNALLDDLQRVFIDSDLMSCVECNLDAWCAVCRKIRVFYDLGCERGQIGELLSINKSIFVEYSEEDFVRTTGFFYKLGVRKEDVGMLLLERPDILGFDLENPVISVLGVLKHFGMEEKELKSIAKKYPYVLGRNKMVNLPRVMRALDLQEWFFKKMKNGDHGLLVSYDASKFDEDLDSDFQAGLDMIQSSRYRVHMLSKLNFLQSVGYGENKFIIKVISRLHGNGGELQERFECLVRHGIEFSKLLKMVSLSPKILNQNAEILEHKMIFLTEEVGSSFQLLDAFPAFLCYDLEKRIKPRYRFHKWLLEKGLCTKSYSLASIIATSEKNFLHRLSIIDPAGPEQWLEFKQKSEK